MVHTRHTRDVEPDSPPRFLSLESARSRKLQSRAADVDEHDSDHSAVYGGKQDGIFDGRVESRLRPRTGPRAYNYVYGDSSDDEMTMSRGRRSRVPGGPISKSRGGHSRYESPRETRKTRRGRISSDEEEEESPPQRGQWYGKQSLRQRNVKAEEDEEGDEDGDEENHDEEDEEDDDANNSALRRSSRLSVKPYRFRGGLQAQGNGDNSVGIDRPKRRRNSDGEGNDEEEYEDMYSRVKRARTKISDPRAPHSASDDDDKNDSEAETQQRRSYSLREHKPRTQLYMAPAIESKRRTKQQSLFRETPPRQTRHKARESYRSPAHRKLNFRKRHAFHGSSSSTSSDSDSGTETSDEQHFSRRKVKSLAKARSRICPLNFTKDMVTGPVKDRVRAGASLADVDPMEIDRSVTFDSVGGLQKHIMALKEMVVFPLLYPEFYDHFKVAPSRGVLFYGPPGTGKTLVARALANECSRGSQKVAFFMRKGADCLSKWVGEAERQLRLLFDKAYEMRPSIIFFDEIDGLAPVRSSRQDQIHSSIVSTLLALMDGIDSRGEIVIIGATNRIDSIDPALRRPGRFDKEFHFPLPSLLDRKKILQIHTKNWSPLLRDDFLLELSEKCAGYCGADVKCLVTEATQNALRRHYPQIYTTSDKLQLNIPSIQLTARDFAQAMATIVPAAQRAVANPAMALEASVRPLLSRSLLKLQDSLNNRFPYAKADRRSNAASAAANEQGAESTHFDLELASDEEDNTPSIFRSLSRGSKSSSNQLQPATPFLAFSSSASSFPTVFRPRMLVCGQAGQGQTVHLAPAALHLMEHLPVHTLNSATLFAASAKMPEEACANVFLEAKRTAPSIIYMPYVSELWHVVTDSLRVTFLTFVRSMNPSTPVLILATCEASYIDLDDQLKQLFSHSGGEVVEVGGPTAEERRQFFVDLILQQPLRPPSTHKQAEKWQAESVKFFPQKGIKAKKYNNLLVVEGTAETELSPVSEICRAFDSETRSLIVHPRGRYTKLTCAASARHPETDWSTTCFSDTRQQTAQSKNSRSQPRNSRSQPVKNSTSVTTKQCSVPLSQIQTPLRQAIENQRNSRIVTSAYSHISSKTNIQSRHSRNVTPCLSQTQLSSKNATPSTSRSTKSGSTVASSSSRSTGSRTAQNLANTSRSKAAGFSVTKNVAIGACCAKATKSVISRKSLGPSCTKLSRAAPSLSQAKTTSRSKAPPANSKPQKVVLALSARKKAPFYSPYSREASLGVCLKAAEVRKGYSTGKRSRASPAKKKRSSKSYNYNWKPRKKSYRGKQRKKYTNKNRRKKKYRPLRRSDNLNYNHSACSSISSFSVLQYPMAFVGYTKLYPSLKSPYNQHNFQSAGDHCGYLIGQQVASSPRSKRRARRVLEPLKKAPPPEPRRLTDKEQRKLIEQEDDTLRELRIFLRDILSKLGREKKFSIFTKPVDVDEVTDYYDIIKKPMDLSTIMANIDLHKYTTASTFLEDIFLISSNALEYNPDRGPTDRAIRHRACALRDMAMALLKAELDPEFEKTCHEIENSRKQRGVDGSRNAPAFYHTRPLGATALGLAGDAPLPPPAIPEGCRYSRRVRGLEADQTLPLEAVEKTVQVERSLLKEDKEVDKEVTHNVESSSQGEESGSSQQTIIMNGDNDAEMTEELDKSMEEDCRPETVGTSVCKCPPASSPTPSKKLSPIHSGNSKGSLSKPLTPEEVKKARRVRAHQSPWCRTRRRRRHHSTPVDRHGLDHDHSHQGSDVEEEVSEEEDEERAILEGHDSPRRDHSGSSRKEHRDGWHGGHHREHSPVSAANPANVNVSGRTRRSLDQVPTPTQPALEVSNKPVEVPFNKPAEVPFNKPAEVPFNKPAEVPFNKPAEVAFNKPEEVPSKAPSDSKPKEASTAEESGSKQKPGAVRNLEVDLLTAAADSGVGSESNGDSRDSLDHNNSNRSGAANSTEKEREDGTANNSTSFARTRSRTQNPMQLNALAALEVETRTVQVDKARLDKLLESTVAATKGFTVERLQHLFSSLSCAIYHHRQEFDKTALVEEMEKVVRNFCVELEARH